MIEINCFILFDSSLTFFYDFSESNWSTFLLASLIRMVSLVDYWSDCVHAVLTQLTADSVNTVSFFELSQLNVLTYVARSVFSSMCTGWIGSRQEYLKCRLLRAPEKLRSSFFSQFSLRKSLTCFWKIKVRFCRPFVSLATLGFQMSSVYSRKPIFEDLQTSRDGSFQFFEEKILVVWYWKRFHVASFVNYFRIVATQCLLKSLQYVELLEEPGCHVFHLWRLLFWLVCFSELFTCLTF